MSGIIDFDNYSQDFIWDYKLHFPIPTLTYILNRTGEDILSKYGTETEANSTILKITRFAKNYLLQTRDNMLKWEYKIARDIDLLYEVLEYLLSFIDYAIIMGRYDELFNRIDKNEVIPSLEIAKQNLSVSRNAGFYIPHSEIRVGY